jgi:hypothetical protein
MTPLLVSAIASTAGNLIEKWASAGERKAEVQSANFQEMLNKTAGAGRSGQAKTPQDSRMEAIAKLRAELLDAPEVRLAIDSADPSKPVGIELGPDGKLYASAPGRAPQAIQLAPDTAAAARELAALIPPAGAINFPMAASLR